MIPKQLRVRAYQDNEGEVRIGFATPDPIVHAAMAQFDQDRQDRELAEKMIAMDALWAATPMEDAMGLADKLHEVTRDASIEIDTWRRRFRGAILLAAVGWSLLTWIAIAAIWRAL